jgi:uncharacterized protein (TIGR00304 family)
MRPDKIFIGFALIFMGIVLLTSAHAEYGVVIVGPIPIIFATSPNMAIFVIILAAIMLLVYAFMRW